MIHVLQRIPGYPENPDGTLAVSADRDRIEFRARFSDPAAEDVIRDGLERGDYNHVADIRKDHLEVAYAVSQNIEANWTSHSDVDAKVDKARSTSMGDILIDAEGRCHVVVMVGFRAVEDPDIVGRLRELVR
ncbi:hypothetical protein [Salipiger mucosus]|uniref:Uncharacterized protein n=1 Tax=Salipiger mucosus DSM 16094 TaxID=1123237 RepID=S9QWD8_9RHOB|nr:hypothetical protein [Salipiger mucosus]EPX83917.1 hypothetical protein Salmuc_01692 [Salipiger mucosus DSM 16094]